MLTDQRREEIIDSAHQYALDVQSGRIVVGKWIRLAVARYFKLIEEWEQREIYFDEKKAAQAIDFFSAFLKHTKGPFAGRIFELSPWQAWIIWCLFGFYRNDETRLYRRAYLKVARKNGKSTFMAGVALYMLYMDGEEGAEVYSVATKKDQAKIIFEEAKRMVRKTAALAKAYKVWKHEIEVEATSGKFVALGSDADTLDGLNTHLAIVDEYHAHKNDEVYDVISSSMGARNNPMQLVITTAGLNLTSPCYDMERDCKGVLDGFYDDDQLFIAIYEIDAEDAQVEEYEEDGVKKTRYGWANPENYIKANPNLGVSVKLKDLIAESKVAVRRISKRREFITKKCNIWYNAPDAWIKAEHWNEAYWEVSLEELKGRKCYGGMDLAQTQDFTSFSILFPMDDGREVLLSWQWIPEETVEERISGGLHTLSYWIDEGLVFTTPGNATDYNAIEAFVDWVATEFNLRHIYYDMYNANQIAGNLNEKGIECTGVPQNQTHVGEATQQFELGILKKTINHRNNPVLGWMANNVVLNRYPSGVAMVNKNKSKEKIDGITSSILAKKCVMEQNKETPFQMW